MNTNTESLLLSERYDATALVREIAERLYPEKLANSEQLESCIRDLHLHMAVLNRAIHENDEVLFCE